MSDTGDHKICINTTSGRVLAKDWVLLDPVVYGVGSPLRLLPIRTVQHQIRHLRHGIPPSPILRTQERSMNKPKKEQAPKTPAQKRMADRMEDDRRKARTYWLTLSPRDRERVPEP